MIQVCVRGFCRLSSSFLSSRLFFVTPLVVRPLASSDRCVNTGKEACVRAACARMCVCVCVRARARVRVRVRERERE
jgi:hypothetical protein